MGHLKDKMDIDDIAYKIAKDFNYRTGLEIDPKDIIRMNDIIREGLKTTNTGIFSASEKCGSFDCLATYHDSYETQGYSFTIGYMSESRWIQIYKVNVVNTPDIPNSFSSYITTDGKEWLQNYSNKLAGDSLKGILDL